MLFLHNGRLATFAFVQTGDSPRDNSSEWTGSFWWSLFFDVFPNPSVRFGVVRSYPRKLVDRDDPCRAVLQ